MRDQCVDLGGFRKRFWSTPAKPLQCDGPAAKLKLHEQLIEGSQLAEGAQAMLRMQDCVTRPIALTPSDQVAVVLDDSKAIRPLVLPGPRHGDQQRQLVLP